MANKDKFLDIPLEDMDVLEICSELGITPEDIIGRFKDRVEAYERAIDAGIEWDDEDGYDDDYDDFLNEAAREIIEGE